MASQGRGSAFRRAGIALLLLGFGMHLAGCTDGRMNAERGQPRTGIVSDRVSGRPIVGAFVTFEWVETVSSFVDTHDHCIHVQLRRTDGGGEFEIPTYRGYLPSAVVIYARGYERPPLAYGGETGFPMDSFAGSRERRFKQVWGLVTACPAGKESQQDLYEVDRAMLEELRELATSVEERNMVKMREAGRHGLYGK